MTMPSNDIRQFQRRSLDRGGHGVGGVGRWTIRGA
jgi:hypothetical protein